MAATRPVSIDDARTLEAAPEDHAARLARARSVLGLAERTTARRGSGIDRTVLRPVPGPAGADESASLQAPGRRGSTEPDLPGALLPVPEPLRGLFPHGGLRPGVSLAVTGTATTSLLLALAAAATGESGWCAVAGMGDLGLRCALDAGLDPTRLAIVPARDTQMPKILSALVDGVGVLVLGPDLELTPALWRSLSDRARARDVLLLATEPPGRSDLRLLTSGGAWTGLSRGSGRLRTRWVDLTCQGRGIAGERRARILMPHVTGRLAAAPSAAGTRPQKTAHPAAAAATPTGSGILSLHERRAG